MVFWPEQTNPPFCLREFQAGPQSIAGPDGLRLCFDQTLLGLIVVMPNLGSNSIGGGQVRQGTNLAWCEGAMWPLPRMRAWTMYSILRGLWSIVCAASLLDVCPLYPYDAMMPIDSSVRTRVVQYICILLSYWNIFLSVLYLFPYCVRTFCKSG